MKNEKEQQNRLIEYIGDCVLNILKREEQATGEDYVYVLSVYELGSSHGMVASNAKDEESMGELLSIAADSVKQSVERKKNNERLN